LMWLFGDAGGVRVYQSDPKRMAGYIDLEYARVRWLLSIDKDDLPYQAEAGGNTTYRSITVDGQEIEFSSGFTDLHTRVYERTISGNGFRIADARPSIVLTHRIRTAPLMPLDELSHPLLRGGSIPVY
jgi:UDP-N-acetyl-2-amino-2-deoxyglucuronate dehydrogenase